MSFTKDNDGRRCISLRNPHPTDERLASYLRPWSFICGSIAVCRFMQAGSGRFDFDKFAPHPAILRRAEKVALFLGAIVIVPADGATAVRSDRRAARLAFSETVEMAVEHSN